MRLKKSMLNTMTSIGVQIIILFFSFLSRRIFLDTLGLEALGVHGFLSNIISWLSLADLGIGNAVCYALYEPLERKNTKLIASFQNFLKKIFKYVCVVYIVIVTILIPFIVYSNKNVFESITIVSVFIIWAITQLLSLHLYYNTVILIADQKLYKLKIVEIIFSVLRSVAQIAVLLMWRDYLLYTITLLVFTLLQNFYQKRIVKQEYPYLYNKHCILEEDIQNNIFTKTKALVLHGVADFILNSTDNIIVINVLGAGVSGIFTNYQMIFYTLQKFLSQIVSGTVSSVGNYLVTETKEKSYQLFLNISWIANFLFTVCAVSGYLLANKFIVLVYGKELFLDHIAVLFLSMNLFVVGLRCGPQIFRNAAALYEKDRYLRLLFGLSNLFFSLILSKVWGITGILIATTFNLVGEELIVLPLLIIQQQLFHHSVKEYYFNVLKAVAAFLISVLGGTVLLKGNIVENLLLDFILSGCISVIFSVCVFIIVNIRTKELRYFIGLVQKKR